MSSKRLTRLILAGLALGILLGLVVHSLGSGHFAAGFADSMDLLPFAFLRLIKMIIAPLVFATLAGGVARMGDVATAGRIGGKALAWFMFSSLISLLLGLVLVQVFEPGKSLHLVIPPEGAATGVADNSMSLRGFIEHTLPVSVFDAMARNEILQLVVFALFFGTAMASLGARARIVLEGLEALAHIMLKVTGYVMLFAPLAVLGALASTIAKQGLAVIGMYGLLIVEFYLGLAVLLAILTGFGLLFIGRRTIRLLRRVREPVLLAFSTASSEAAYPRTLEELERFGCSNRVASFVLPMGYSFNLAGSMMYCGFAVLFIAQIYGIALGLGQQALLVAVLMLTSKGIAGVPRASLVVVAATLPQFHLPQAGLLLLLGADHFLDMGRTGINVVGNSIAAALVSKWEGELTDESDRALPDAARPRGVSSAHALNRRNTASP
ncbi:MAG TPA: dicarboxylate/amino acid:cation symporter [Steroidobacteraceae bacterium]|nr:dicarboxylate/amino acid:cation symporter [Steroidobacteraceae bacterium]